jgi:hypothetical protein
MNIFPTLTAGDSIKWSDGPQKHPQYSSPLTSAEWNLYYQLRGPSSLSIQAFPESDGWRTEVPASASANLEAGPYLWVAQLHRADERLTIGKGSLTILPDLAAVNAALDARTFAQKALADCEAALASFKSSNGKVKSYTIGSRTTEFHSLTELMSLRSFWQRRVNKERANSAKTNGRPSSRALLVSFA